MASANWLGLGRGEIFDLQISWLRKLSRENKYKKVNRHNEIDKNRTEFGRSFTLQKMIISKLTGIIAIEFNTN